MNEKLSVQQDVKPEVAESSADIFFNELEIAVRARYPLLGIQTFEEERATEIIKEVAQKLSKRLFGWSVARGLLPLDVQKHKHYLDKSSTDPQMALQQILELVDPALFLFFDFHPYMKEPAIIRKLREIVQMFKKDLKTLILLSPQLTVPFELEKEIAMISLHPPGMLDLKKLLDDVLDSVVKRGDVHIELDNTAKERLIQGISGLTLNEAENVLAKAIVSQGGLSLDALNLIVREKEQIIRRSGVLEFYSTFEKISNIGGLENLKDWLRKRGKSFSHKARAFGLPAPKGILLIGVQGCGKSLTAKAIASYWNMPLLKLDVGSLFSSLLGSTEENLRTALRTAENVAPAVLWVDEIEKGFAGLTSSGKLDAGVSARVLGTLITWLQEKSSPVFVIATANDISALPPEMLRKGRFDEIFFVDLPSASERRRIFEIHLGKRNFDPDHFDLDRLVAESRDFSGAEIESGIISAMYDIFDSGENMTTDHIVRALQETVPLAKLMTEKLDDLRTWAEGRVRRASLSDPEEGVSK